MLPPCPASRLLVATSFIKLDIPLVQKLFEVTQSRIQPNRGRRVTHSFEGGVCGKPANNGCRVQKSGAGRLIPTAVSFGRPFVIANPGGKIRLRGCCWVATLVQGPHAAARRAPERQQALPPLSAANCLSMADNLSPRLSPSFTSSLYQWLLRNRTPAQVAFGAGFRPPVQIRKKELSHAV